MGIPIPITTALSDCYMEEAKQLINLSEQLYIKIHKLEENLQLQEMGISYSDDDDDDDLESLVTNNDEPRSSQDAEAIRYIKYQLCRLHHQHRKVKDQVTKILHLFHQSKTTTAREHGQPMVLWDSDDGTDNDSDNDSDSDSYDIFLLRHQTSVSRLLPFGKISNVLPGSPASVAGLQQNDLVLQFGEITSENYDQQQPPFATIAQAYLDQPLEIKVWRNYHERRSFYPVPRTRWGGLGVLGCHILPI